MHCTRVDSIQFIQRQIGLNQGWCHLLLCVMSTPQKINNRFQIELESKYGRLDVFDRANNMKGFLLQTFCNNINSVFSKKATKFEKTYLILFWSLTTTDRPDYWCQKKCVTFFRIMYPFQKILWQKYTNVCTPRDKKESSFLNQAHSKKWFWCLVTLQLQRQYKFSIWTQSLKL